MISQEPNDKHYWKTKFGDYWTTTERLPKDYERLMIVIVISIANKWDISIAIELDISIAVGLDISIAIALDISTAIKWDISTAIELYLYINCYWIRLQLIEIYQSQLS